MKTKNEDRPHPAAQKPENGSGSPPDTEAPKPPTAQQTRLQACMTEMGALLEKHRCQIIPRFGQVIPVGTVGDTIQIQSRWDLAALPDPPPQP